MTQIIESVEAANLVVPADYERFELLVDNTIDPMEVARAAEYVPKGYKYLGPKFDGLINYRTKFIHLGYVRNLGEAREHADKMDLRFLEGQAREIFKKKYPMPDDNGPIVFGGSEWQDPDGEEQLACLRRNFGGSEWISYFYPSGSCFTGDWRWLVVDK